MALPILGDLRDLFGAQAADATGRAATGATTALLAAMSLMLVVAAGLVALTARVGFPLAAIAFAAGFALLALAVRMIGQAQTARRAAQVAAARHRVATDIAVATALSRSARPYLPLAAFAAAFVLARRP